jgi:hypothetical protein
VADVVDMSDRSVRQDNAIVRLEVPFRLLSLCVVVKFSRPVLGMER